MSASVLCVGDVHLSDRPPSSCTDTYLEDLLDLLEQTVELAAARGVDAVVWAGDVFHHKAPSRTSHQTVQRAIDLVRAYACPLLIVPGNHDMQNDRLESVSETQPLGTLLRAGAVLLDGPHPGLPLYGAPWRQSWDDLSFPGYRSGDLMVAHAPLYPPGQESPFECVSSSEWARAMGAPGYVYYGHVHERHGVWQRAVTVDAPPSNVIDSYVVTFCNAGAVTRGSLHEYDLTRQVSVTLWAADVGGVEPHLGSFEEVPLRARPPSEVFRLAAAEELRTATARLDEFLATVGSTTVDVASVEAVRREVELMEGVEPAVRQAVLTLLEGVS